MRRVYATARRNGSAVPKRAARAADRAGSHADHALARFVGATSHAAAGGGVRRDLLRRRRPGTYLIDAVLLDKLVRAARCASRRRAPRDGPGSKPCRIWLTTNGRRSRPPCVLTSPRAEQAQARRIALSLESRLEKIDAELEEACEAETRPGPGRWRNSGAIRWSRSCKTRRTPNLAMRPPRCQVPVPSSPPAASREAGSFIAACCAKPRLLLRTLDRSHGAGSARRGRSDRDDELEDTSDAPGPQ